MLRASVLSTLKTSAQFSFGGLWILRVSGMIKIYPNEERPGKSLTENGEMEDAEIRRMSSFYFNRNF